MCWESKALRRISVLFGGSFRKHFWRVGICVIHASGRLFVEFATIHVIQCSSSFLTTVKVTWYRSWGLPLSSISSSHLTFRNPHLTLLISFLLKTHHSVGIRSAPPPLELIVCTLACWAPEHSRYCSAGLHLNNLERTARRLSKMVQSALVRSDRRASG
ncbi:hypothetical protein BJX68DRAFT_161729 [Aspergillus pseudodeflectus]|uniref:Uncharacterized protein n=1 Tax=Aspergillus pseudodeflectus TaxID=176178 RepID=A0ABR4L0X1_9EURO